ncbi:MAG: 2TM domain-containing protein [Promethearchaeota archaeon]|nr:MAG: 2TM domain-containing protein [Candidatus Lokiarchaeota archaeon]
MARLENKDATLENLNAEYIPTFDESGLRKIAKEIILQRLFLILHSLLYFFVNLLLFAINFLTYQSYPWFLWSITGWGVVLSTHSFQYILYKRGVVNLSTLGMAYHLFGFIIINLFLLFTNFFTNPTIWTFNPWFWFSFVYWSAILVCHAILYFYIVPSKGESTEKNWLERKVDKELQKLQKLKKISDSGN